MAENGNQGNGSQGQEPGAGNQGQSQEDASQQGQQGTQGQEPTGGQEDITKMSPEALVTYAAKLQKDAQEARQEAGKYRTQYQSATDKIAQAEREKLSDTERLQADLADREAKLAEREAKETELQARVDDLTRGQAVREVLAQAGALNPATAFKVGDWATIKLNEDGTLDQAAALEAIAKLKTSDPYLFRRTAQADAGAGSTGGAPEAGASINDFVRGGRGR